MNAEQKRAWLAVVTGIVCLILYLALVPILGPWPATATFALFAINGFAGLIGRKEQVDERDKTIARHATLAGGMASYGAFALGCMGTWFAVFAWQGKEQISVHVLGTITLFGFMAFYFVRSVAVLVLYRRHVEAGNV